MSSGDGALIYGRGQKMYAERNYLRKFANALGRYMLVRGQFHMHQQTLSHYFLTRCSEISIRHTDSLYFPLPSTPLLYPMYPMYPCHASTVDVSTLICAHECHVYRICFSSLLLWKCTWNNVDGDSFHSSKLCVCYFQLRLNFEKKNSFVGIRMIGSRMLYFYIY